MRATDYETPRAKYIRENYSLTQDAAGNWVAETAGCEWSDNRRIIGGDRAEVCRRFRALWGHFNFDDEAEAFDKIFA